MHNGAWVGRKVYPVETFAKVEIWTCLHMIYAEKWVGSS